MNRQKMSRAENCISYSQRFNEAQSLFLSPAKSLAAANANVIATTQRPLLLQSIGVSSTQFGNITDIKVAGQSLNCSDSSAAIGSFLFEAQGAQNRTIGLTINNNQTVSVEAVLAAGGDFGFAISAYPIDPSQVRSLKEQADRYNFYFGLGTAAPGAAGTATMTATATRGCVLGEVRLSNQTAGGAVPDSDLVVSSFKVSGIEMLAGDTNQEVPFSAFTGSSTDVLGLALDYPIEPNAIVQVVVENKNGGAAATVGGVIFVAPFTKA